MARCPLHSNTVRQKQLSGKLEKQKIKVNLASWREREREKEAENYQVLLTMASTLQSEASKFYMMECHNIYKEMNEKISKGN